MSGQCTGPVLAFLVLLSPALQREKTPQSKPASGPAPVIWKDPGAIAARNLLYGPGGKEHAPKGKYSFIKEDMNGTGPKFEVRDEQGVEWKVKVGGEARPETAASRLLWGVGYFVNEDYYLPEIQVEGLPTLRRGQAFVSAGGLVHGARLKRHLETESDWSWFENPFVGTREFDGLKVAMALINNWDLKDLNSKVSADPGGEKRYFVSDLGESFGDPAGQTQGDLNGYGRTEFIDQVSAKDVTFFLPNRPPWYVMIFEHRKYRERSTMQQIVQHIPREHVKWMAQLFSQLTPEQVRDCFRASGYSLAEADGFARVVLARVARLNKL